MNELIRQTLSLVVSSKRSMPARFTRNGDRNESFCIDFKPLTKEHDEAMAAESWGSTSNFLSTDKYKGEVQSKKQFELITRCGEDLMVGSFIITKLKGSSLLLEMKKAILNNTIDNFNEEINNLKSILIEVQVNKYFDYCIDYGHKRAKSNI